mmetsp:Transcript_17638/g.31901  ORF Transcript_17638/g.31901 Transcript_17638/m.31901 type:complete len:349 (-) Transcript_17638:145-1191(-)
MTVIGSACSDPKTAAASQQQSYSIAHAARAAASSTAPPLAMPPTQDILDLQSFPVFTPLLAASQKYAWHSGCRFRSNSFVGVPEKVRRSGRKHIPVVGMERSTDLGPRLASKIEAAPAVRVFTERLQAAEPALTDEASKAFRLVMAEAVRNAMVATFRRLELWPPSPAPQNVPEADCNYQDMAVPLPVLAQRTYNDEMQRIREEAYTGSPGLTVRKARTAAFIVDFAQEVGVSMPAMPEEQHKLLKEFMDRVAASEHLQDAPGDEGETGKCTEPVEHHPLPQQGHVESTVTQEKAPDSFLSALLVAQDENLLSNLEEVVSGYWAKGLIAMRSMLTPSRQRPRFDPFPV